MHPILFNFGPITLYSFGFFLFLAFFTAIFTIWLHGRREGFDEEKILDACLFVSLFGVIGGRIGYFLAHRGLFCVLCFFRVSAVPGFSWLAAVFSGLFGLWVFCSRKKLDFLKFLDLMVLGVALGEGIGRLGCFFSGTAYGKQTTFFWGVSQIGLWGKRHPVQLLSALSSFFVFWFLLKGKTKRHFAGFIGLVFFILSGWFLFLLEFLKEEGVYFGGIKFSQVVGFLTGVLGTVWLYKKQKRNLREDLENIVARLISLGGKGYILLSRYTRNVAGIVKSQKFKIQSYKRKL